MRRIAGRFVLVVLSVSLMVGGLEWLVRRSGVLLTPQDAMRTLDRSPARYHASADRLHPWANESSDPVRVAVIGDSFSMGSGVQFDDAYPSRLERMLNLNAGTRPVVVRCYCQSGTSTYQQLALLNDALAWNPAVVVLGICMNDTEDWTRAEELRSWRREMDFHPPTGLVRTLTEHSYLAAFVYSKREYARANRGYLHYYQRLYRPDYSGWKRFNGAIAMFRDQCQTAGCEFVAMVFPLLSGPFDESRYPFEDMHERVLDVLASNEISHIDLLREMRRMDPVRMQAIPRLDPHPSEIAHRVAAETLFAALLTYQWFDESYAPEVDTLEHAVWQRKIKERQVLPTAAESK